MRWLRKILFPQRDTAPYENEADSILKEIVDAHTLGRNRTKAELELETRAWFRDFWTRSIVAWLALFISIISVVIAICAFFRR